ncbi:hypothetical protein [Alistipes ihumii]|uniref:hypothetical protein n=1 Tax=Alistipes ihumii TaxID=1470347 RepID=UPI003FEEEC7B
MYTQESARLILVDRRTIEKLSRSVYAANCRLVLLASVAYVKNMEYTLTAEDVCDLLQIDFDTFDRYIIKMAIKGARRGNMKVYTLDDMVKVAERCTRSKRQKAIYDLPTFTVTSSAKSDE